MRTALETIYIFTEEILICYAVAVWYCLLGRPTYISEANEFTPLLYLFHTQTPDLKAGVGRWVIGDIFGSKDLARAFVDSWAVTPYFSLDASDGSGRETNLWHVSPYLLSGCFERKKW